MIIIPGQAGDPDRNVDDMQDAADTYDYILIGVYSIIEDAGFSVGLPYSVDDAQFVWDLIAKAKKWANITKVYIYGSSNGGALSHYICATKTKKVNAFATVAGSMLDGVTISRTGGMSVLTIHGQDDVSVPYGGGLGSSDYTFESAQETFEMWAEHNGTKPGTLLTNVNFPFTEATEKVYSSGGYQNIFLDVPGYGHNVGTFDEVDLNYYVAEFFNEN